MDFVPIFYGGNFVKEIESYKCEFLRLRLSMSLKTINLYLNNNACKNSKEPKTKANERYEQQKPINRKYSQIQRRKEKKKIS